MQQIIGTRILLIIFLFLFMTGCMRVKVAAEFESGTTDVMAVSRTSSEKSTTTNTYNNSGKPASVGFADTIKDAVKDAVDNVTGGDNESTTTITKDTENKIQDDFDRAIQDALDELKKGN